MNELYNYKSFSILYVDDEVMSTKYFKLNLEHRFSILVANNAEDGLSLFEQNKDSIGLIITDQRMPGRTGVELLENVRRSRPKIIRILTTAFSDIEAAIDAVNDGAIYKYVAKPWNERELEITLMRALEFFMIQRERDGLFQEKIAAFHRLLMTDRLISLGLLAVGTDRYLRHALPAIKSFLALAPTNIEEELVDLSQLRSPDYWTEFYCHARLQLRKVGDMIDSIARQGFGDEVKFSAEIVKASGNDSFFSGNSSVGPLILDEPLIKCNARMINLLGELLIKLFGMNDSNLKKFEIIHSNFGREIAIQIELNRSPFSEVHLKAVFDPFYPDPVKSSESGFDLLSCYLIIYHHGGTIAISEPRKTINIILPLNPIENLVRDDEVEFLDEVFTTESSWHNALL